MVRYNNHNHNHNLNYHHHHHNRHHHHHRRLYLPTTTATLQPPAMADPSAIPTQTDEQPLPSEKPQIRVPSLRSISDSPSMHASSKPLGPVDAARRGPIHTPFAAGGLSKDVQDRLKAFQASRSGAPPTGGNASSPGAHMRGVRPTGPNWISAPVIPGRQMPGMPKLSLADRRKIGFPGGLPGAGAPTTPGMTNNAPRPGGMKGRAPPGNLTSQGSLNGGIPNANGGSQFDQYSQYLDKETGALKFENKAVLHNRGVDFSSGSSFTMSRDELEVLEELGKGNYGTVYKVVHKSKAPLGRRQSVSREQPYVSSPDTPGSSGLPTPEDQDRPSLLKTIVPGTVMAMKEIRLELDENKFAQIIMELDVLHRCRSPYIIDFYGAFFSEGAVFICMEHMDGGSIDKLYGGGIPEGVLRKIALGTIIGLKTLKESHNIIHRDVKPTNILVNTRGDVKLCDFGVSGNLVASIAKTNIGCQSYMAPERISSGGAQAAMGGSSGPIGTYGVQSDVWSLGLSILECAMGCYPYPPETYNNIFSQLSVSHLPSVL